MRELEQDDVAETVIEEGDEAEGVKPSIEPQWNATAVINWAIFSTIALHGTKRAESIPSGTKPVLKSLRSSKGKLIIISNNCPPLRKSEIEYYAMLSKVGVHHYNGRRTFIGSGSFIIGKGGRLWLC
ncbi:hypothetical protein F0562_013119 [Nyssa sinensis]|uniref:Ribosomal protein eL8/eL30/eS12/Gadd45 domain-containing protein n=1 Tax=Nyssa sinensis TaxID=561372 RepID=A0A5J4ZVX2_9ASTE|nr:hypothetical protein F0562_013119 [Nyssa sinensis]